MYIGVDFLIHAGKKLYLSEINTGLPAGASEYDLVYRERFNRSSGIFTRIDTICRNSCGKSFGDTIKTLPHLRELRALKIWMDGRGRLPSSIPPALRLEDKWIQYQLLSDDFPLIPTREFSPEDITRHSSWFEEYHSLALKKKLGRGGKSLVRIRKIIELKHFDAEKNSWLIQPWLDSTVGPYTFSVRAAAFEGRFLCMFASLTRRMTSNHGLRVYVRPGRTLRLQPDKFRTRKIRQTCWEAELFYEGKIPEYLNEDVTFEEIAETELVLPQRFYRRIQRIAASLSRKLSLIDPASLPPSHMES
ncbi:MAG: hypothetical protein JXB23_06940 [Candidatus Aminicenantes bacterium]|nr:hypothetical protein [Candidatus Aminicenantes bacterium]